MLFKELDGYIFIFEILSVTKKMYPKIISISRRAGYILF